jgi:hypothetical protein
LSPRHGGWVTAYRTRAARESLSRGSGQERFRAVEPLVVRCIAVRRNPACVLAFQLAEPSVSSRAERPGLVPQLVFKTV